MEILLLLLKEMILLNIFLIKGIDQDDLVSVMVYPSVMFII